MSESWAPEGDFIATVLKSQSKESEVFDLATAKKTMDKELVKSYWFP